MEQELKIREVNPSDIKYLRTIWYNHFKDEFDFPDFLNGYYCAFLVENNNEIVAAAGVKPLAEVVLLTNKDLNNKVKLKALNRILDASEFVAKINKHHSLHAFIQDEGWQQHLMKRANFKPTKGQSLFLELT